MVEWVGNIVQRVPINFSALREAWKEWRNAPEALKYEAWKLHIREQDYVQDVKELTEEKQGLLDKLIDPNDVRIKDLEAEVAKVDLELTSCKVYVANHGGNQEEENLLAAAEVRIDELEEENEKTEGDLIRKMQEIEELKGLLNKTSCVNASLSDSLGCGPNWRGRIRMGDIRDLLVDIKCWIYEWVSNVCSVVWKDLVLGNSGECRIACQAFWVVKETGLLLFRFLKLAWRILQSTIPWGQIYIPKGSHVGLAACVFPFCWDYLFSIPVLEDCVQDNERI